jgi:hypothetical protein
MVYFHTKNLNLGIQMYFRGPLNGKGLYSLWSFGVFYCHLVYEFYGRLVNFVVIWYIFHQFGLFNQEKSGNPGQLGGISLGNPVGK